MNYSEMIKLIREKLLLTQQELAELLGVSFVTLNRWENGVHEPTMKVKRKIKELMIKNNIDIEVK